MNILDCEQYMGSVHLDKKNQTKIFALPELYRLI